MNTARALLYARTVSHLRPTQVLDRLWRRIKHARPDLSPTPARRSHLHSSDLVAFASRVPSLVGPTRFRFLGEEREIQTRDDWASPDASKLWLYNLHYFDDLRAESADQRAAWHAALIVRWIDENPPAEGCGWEPYTTSLRIVNWIRWSLSGGALPPQAMPSLAVQARWLRANLERHLLGNHLFANAKALVFAGLFFEGDEAKGWLADGLALIERELTEQILADGGHFERSPMYHAIILEDVLDLIALSRGFEGVESELIRYSPKRWVGIANRMRRWLQCLSHPDGEIAFFNDAAFGIAPTPAKLEAYALALGLPAVQAPKDGALILPDTGYVRVQRDELVALLDVGEIGPGYLPGHAHADTLSFEISLAGRRTIVNTGTSVYRVCPEREHQRSTRAHNTVEVDSLDSSEVWASFRVARRAMPVGLTLEDTRDGFEVRCAHDGYRRLPGRVLHRRAWRFGERALQIIDRIDGAHASAVSRLHFHPSTTVEGEALLGGESDVRWMAQGGPTRVTSTTWHPEFGASLPNSCLELNIEERAGEFGLSW